MAPTPKFSRELVLRLMAEFDNNQSEVARALTEALGVKVTRRAVNHSLHKESGDTRLPYKKAQDLIKLIGLAPEVKNTKHYARLQYHMEYQITGGVGMSLHKKKDLVGLYQKLTEFNLVQVFDPTIPPHAGVVTGGWDYVQRDYRPVEEGGDNGLVLRRNKYAPMSDEDLRLWRLPDKEHWPNV